MSFGEQLGGIDYATSRGRDWPSVRQFNVFLENRLGALMDLVKHFETADIHIVSLMVMDTADCAIIRIVLSNPERAFEILQRAQLPFTESDLLVVRLPECPQPLVTICKALLSVEIDVDYAYPLLVGPDGHAAMALHVSDHETAAQTLSGKGFTLFAENDFNS
jgi:hypothetical protein